MPSYFSLGFACVFFPITMLMYSIVPKRVRWVVLLLMSYAFIWGMSGKLIVFVLISTLSIYLCGLRMAKCIKERDARLAGTRKGRRQIKAECKKRMRLVLILGIVFNLAILVALKYLGFFSEIASWFLSLMGTSVTFDLLRIGVPIGISFYTLMAISYLIDVYRGTVEADRHLGRVALFLVFFPQIMEGPFCRYQQTAYALTAGEPLRRRNCYEGLLRILFGVAKKAIVADRLDAFVKLVFDNHADFNGGVIAFAAILYTLELYCDFSGTMDVALGMGRIFNVVYPENFRQPFFSRTASEFWQRWHITLGAWFKDYVYYPVSLSRPCKRLMTVARKKVGARYGPLVASSVALFCVWMGNGLWHGAGSQYLFFGMYYFVLIVASGFVEPVVQNLAISLDINRETIPYRVLQTLRTLVIIFVGEMFFRANSLQAGLDMFRIMVTEFSLDSFFTGTIFSMGLDQQDYLIVAIMLVVVLVVGILKERGHNICSEVATQHVVLRWAIPMCLLFAFIIFGAYGLGYVPIAPMYAQF